MIPDSQSHSSATRIGETVIANYQAGMWNAFKCSPRVVNAALEFLGQSS